MAVRFILGRAGSGKTHHCLEAVRRELRLSQRGPALVLLVPEQATYQVERALVTTPDLDGYCRAYVLSFRRLAYQVFLDVGGEALPPLDATAKQMILRSILRRCAGDLRLFEKSAGRWGFVEQLAAALTEWRAYGHGAEKLRAELAALEERGEGESLLAAKLHDLALVAEEYEQFLADRFADPDAALDLLAERLGRRNRFYGARVWVDGFASFTGQEERVLGALMRIARDVEIALCLDPREAGFGGAPVSEAERGFSMFGLLRDTYGRLERLAREAGQIVRPPLVLPAQGQPTRFSGAPALAHLERTVFSFATEAPAPRPAQREIVVTVAADQRCEVAETAREILKLCREEGFRFREISVIARDLEPYRALIETIFGDFEIPHFIDTRRDVAHHPLVELIRSALAVVTRGWRTEDVLRYAKTDLAGVGRAAVDHLENYALAHGIEGPAWYDEEPWRFRLHYALGEDSEGEIERVSLDALNRARLALVGPLRRFEQATATPGATARDMGAALYGLLDELDAAGEIERWAAEAEREGRLDEASEHRQIWGAVCDLFDQSVAALGGESLSPDEYREIIEAGLAAIRLRLVPPALDQVLVGSIERSRHPEIRAAFVIGMNEGIFPKPQSAGLIFDDRDRERLASDGIGLGPPSEKRQLHERFLAYIAFTRPSERLYISYAEADPAGKALHPSHFLDEVKARFEEIETRRAEREEPIERIGHPRGAVAALAKALRPAAEAAVDDGARAAWIALYERMRRDGRMAELLARRLGGLVYENTAHLSRAVARRLYGGETESSVSRLECFAACPFRHFARYGLGLEERRRFRLEKVELGVFYHAVLRDLYRRLSDGGALDWAEVDEARAAAVLEGVFDSLAGDLAGEFLLSSGRNRYLLENARSALRLFLRVLIETAKRGRFRQVGAEVEFSGRPKENKLGAVEIPLGDGEEPLRLRGRIDRVDEAGDGSPIVRVLDYKSGKKGFSLGDLVLGLSLQLPVYLLALKRGGWKLGRGAFETAGALFMPILRGVRSCSPAEALKATEGDLLDLKGWQARGFFEFRWAEWFDARRAEGKVTYSDIVSLRVKKDGGAVSWGSHDALPDGAIDDILAWTERKLVELARQIRSGRIDVAPYRIGGRTPCRWCEFRPLCRFDGRRQPYRNLRSYKRADALDVIRGQADGG